MSKILRGYNVEPDGSLVMDVRSNHEWNRIVIPPNKIDELIKCLQVHSGSEGDNCEFEITLSGK